MVMPMPVVLSRLKWSAVLVAALVSCGGEAPVATVPPAAPDPAAVVRGEYLVNAANCIGCHTDKQHGGALLAGGKAVETPFGAYYSRNITPDPVNGIGAWSDADFLRALRRGISPSGAHYFPAFPFPSFTRMTDSDIADIRAYLAAQPPQPTKNRPHDVGFPFDVRLTMVPWRMLFFTAGSFQPDPNRDADLEPRRLSRHRGRALRRMPYAAQLPRRRRGRSQLRRRYARRPRRQACA